jgi:ATP-dependent Lon protease
MMLDELDKIGADFRGDPAAALLEALDPEQNSTFTDHYLGVPFDLSRVMFIGTVNYLDPVAPALKDRMEVIELPGYVTDEKVQIAIRYLLRRQLEQNGIADRRITVNDEVIRTLIESYTREAGVRNLERSLGTVCRGLAAKVARGEKISNRITAAELTEYLGPARFEREVAMRDTIPGVATGLAYTPVGGEIIFVEATQMPGRGAFTLTGQLGDVMRESAQAAMSLIRSRAAAWKLHIDQLPKTDIHVHVPAGGVPKDGPSAGVAMLTSLVSLLAGRVADPTVGMTGEITLRGLVLPIGGVKEKVLAAHRAGLKTVVLPARNEPDLHEVPAGIRRELRFVFARQAEDVLQAVFRDRRSAGASSRPARATRRARRGRRSKRRAASGGARLRRVR